MDETRILDSARSALSLTVMCSDERPYWRGRYHWSGCCTPTSSGWWLRACSPPSSPVVHRRRQGTLAMPPPPDRLPPSRQQRRVLGSPKAVLMLRTTARAVAIRSATRHALAFGSGAIAISTRSMRVVWCARYETVAARRARPSEPAVRYEYQGQTFTLDDYLARNPATGLLVARGDTILVERYQYARTIGIASPRGRWPRRSRQC